MASAISSHQLNYANILQILTKILNAGLDALMPMLLLLEHPVVGLILTLVLPILRTEAREEKKAKDSQTRHELKGTDELTDHASERATKIVRDHQNGNAMLISGPKLIQDAHA